jgi:hypothetical protein
MQAVTTIGLDIAKSVFQVHGVDAAGQVLIRSVAPPWRSSRNCQYVRLGSRLAPRRTTARASSKNCSMVFRYAIATAATGLCPTGRVSQG